MTHTNHFSPVSRATEKPSTHNLTVARQFLYTKPVKMENEKGEIVDLYVHFPRFAFSQNPLDALDLVTRIPTSCSKISARKHFGSRQH